MLRFKLSKQLNNYSSRGKGINVIKTIEFDVIVTVTGERQHERWKKQFNFEFQRKL